MSKKISYCVKGTTCKSCEVLLERELLDLPGVLKVKASHKQGCVTMTVEDNVEFHPVELEKKLKDHEYRFLEDIGKEKITSDVLMRIGAAIVIVIGLYILLKQTGFLTFSPSTENLGGFGGVFAVGLVAAFSSCTAVVAGMIVALATKAAKKNEHQTLSSKMRPHIQFHVGRVLGFGVFGAMIGLLGQAFALSPSANAVLIVVLAIAMIAIGINLMNVLPRGLATVSPPKWLSHRVHDLVHSDRKEIPYVLGAATFFLPCGFTQSMQLFAMSTGDPLFAALIMMSFALGTVPVLLGLSFGASSAKGKTLKHITRAAGAFVVVLGIANVTNGATLLGVPVISFAQADAPAAQIIVGDEQVIKMDVNPAGYYDPAILTVVEGVPVRWEITGGNFLGCADTLVMRTFGVNERIRTGLNVVEFTPTKTGKFTFSCSMGMIRGTMNVISSS